MTYVFTVPADGQLPLPGTSATLSLFELATEPAPLREHYDAAGRRWFTYAPGARVQVRARCRVYPDGDGALRNPDELFAGGEPLRAPQGGPR